jgi:hypothetical protein
MIKVMVCPFQQDHVGLRVRSSRYQFIGPFPRLDHWIHGPLDNKHLPAQLRIAP